MMWMSRSLVGSLMVVLLGSVGMVACSGSDEGTSEAVNQGGGDSDLDSDSDLDGDSDGDGVEEAPGLMAIEDLEFVGAFRVSPGTFGESSMNFAEGPLAVHPDGESVFLVGHAHHQAIAEFAIPELVNSTVVTELNRAEEPLQEFARVLNRVENPQRIDRTGGMAFLEDGEGGYDLLIHAWEYYDAPADNTHTTLMLRDPDDLAGSVVEGYYSLEGRAHTNGWVAALPQYWQEALGATHMTGSSGGYPIHSRASIGPTFFTFEPADFMVAPGEEPIPTVALMDFSLSTPLHGDMSNDEGTNDMWTHLSRATMGFVVPGTRTYLTIGKSGGHQSGVCYKCTPEGATSDCGGYCARNVEDNYPFYWAFDLDDLLEVKAGNLEPHEVRPYAYGEFEIPFESRSIGGGAFDAATGRLYLTAEKADRDAGQYSNPPVIMVFEVE